MARRPSPPIPTPEPGSRPMPGLRRFLHRLTATEQQLEAEQLRHDATRTGCALAGRVGRGEVVKLSGRLRTVVYTPRTNVPTLEAALYDGSGTVTLVWLGRRRIAGIEPGQALTVTGRVALRDGQCVVYNPHYQLHS